MLKYTGHPFVDIGAATILAFAPGKTSLAQLTETDLDRVADYIAERYVVNPLKSFLTVVFPNSGFTQPAFDKTPERRQDYVRRVTRGYRAATPVLPERCAFTGDPAVAVAFGDKDGLPEGRAFRQHVPMLLGEGQINFFAGGDAGLPISGKALLCIQAFPLGCAKCGGKLLAVHSDNAEITQFFAARFLQQNRAAISLAQQQGERKLPEAKASARTLLIETLLLADRERYDAQQEQRTASLTAYHFTNSGQSSPLDARNPPLEIYNLPLEILAFLWAIHGPEYKLVWEAVTRRAWRQAQPPKGKKTATQEIDTRPSRNFLYEDLFRLPDYAPQFLRRYLLRVPIRSSYEDDPRRGYSLKDESELVSWSLARLFTERILHMNASRVERIREMGDQLAAYVHEENDQRFFAEFYSLRQYDRLRNSLIRANRAQLKRGQAPIVRLDPYLEVFEEVDDDGRSNWRLARDLVLIRMIERLYDLKWLEQHPEAIPDVADDSESD